MKSTGQGAWYRKAAEQGETEAQLRLGLMYAEGDGLNSDDGQAVHWFREAAERGQHVAQYNLGAIVCPRERRAA